MSDTARDSVRVRALAELVVRLGRITHMRGFDGGLNPTQWAALRFLDRADPHVRTTTAFARANGTTQGSATQTLSVLVAKGLISRQPDPDDGRVVRLQLTEAGRLRLQSDPLADLVEVLALIPLDRSLTFARELAEINQRLDAIEAGRGAAPKRRSTS